MGRWVFVCRGGTCRDYRQMSLMEKKEGASVRKEKYTVSAEGGLCGIEVST